MRKIIQIGLEGGVIILIHGFEFKTNHPGSTRRDLRLFIVPRGLNKVTVLEGLLHNDPSKV